MSNDKKEGMFDLTSAIRGMVGDIAKEETVVRNLTGRVMSEIGKGLRSLAHAVTGGIQLEDVVTPPAQLADGSCFLLLNRLYTGPGMFLMTVQTFQTLDPATQQPAIGRVYSIAHLNEDNLAESQILTPNPSAPEQDVEIQRQLAAIDKAMQEANNGQLMVGTRYYTFHHVSQAIPDFNYFVEPAAAAADTVPTDATVISETPATPVATTPAETVAPVPATDTPAPAAPVVPDVSPAPAPAPIVATVESPAPTQDVVTPAPADAATAPTPAPEGGFADIASPADVAATTAESPAPVVDTTSTPVAPAADQVQTPAA